MSRPSDSERLREKVLEYLFGDGEMDPALLVDEGARAEGFVQGLDELEADLSVLTEAAGHSDAVGAASRARLEILREEVLRAQEHAKEETAQASEGREAQILPFPPPARREPRQEVSPAATGATVHRISWRRWASAGLALAAGLALFLLMPGPTSEVEAPAGPSGILASVTAAEVDGWADTIGGSGHSFAGEEPTPFMRGWLAALAVDAAAAGLDEPATRLAALAVRGLPAGERALTRAQRGCDVLLEAAAQRARCALGTVAYRIRRDIDRKRWAEVDRATRTDEAKALVWWLRERFVEKGAPETLTSAADRIVGRISSDDFPAADAQERRDWHIILRTAGQASR